MRYTGWLCCRGRGSGWHSCCHVKNTDLIGYNFHSRSCNFHIENVDLGVSRLCASRIDRSCTGSTAKRHMFVMMGDPRM